MIGLAEDAVFFHEESEKRRGGSAARALPETLLDVREKVQFAREGRSRIFRCKNRLRRDCSHRTRDAREASACDAPSGAPTRKAGLRGDDADRGGPALWGWVRVWPRSRAPSRRDYSSDGCQWAGGRLNFALLCHGERMNLPRVLKSRWRKGGKVLGGRTEQNVTNGPVQPVPRYSILCGSLAGVTRRASGTEVVSMFLAAALLMFGLPQSVPGASADSATTL